MSEQMGQIDEIGNHDAIFDLEVVETVGLGVVMFGVFVLLYCPMEGGGDCSIGFGEAC